MTYIFGHKNPDTDSIISALVLENLMKKLGKEVKAIRLRRNIKRNKICVGLFKIRHTRA